MFRTDTETLERSARAPDSTSKSRASRIVSELADHLRIRDGHGLSVLTALNSGATERLTRVRYYRNRMKPVFARAKSVFGCVA